METKILIDLQKFLNKPFKFKDLDDLVDNLILLLTQNNIKNNIGDREYNSLFETIYHIYNSFREFNSNFTILTELSVNNLYKQYYGESKDTK